MNTNNIVCSYPVDSQLSYVHIFIFETIVLRTITKDWFVKHTVFYNNNLNTDSKIGILFIKDKLKIIIY